MPASQSRVRCHSRAACRSELCLPLLAPPLPPPAGGLDTRLPIPSWRDIFWSWLGAFLGATGHGTAGRAAHCCTHGRWPSEGNLRRRDARAGLRPAARPRPDPTRARPAACPAAPPAGILAVCALNQWASPEIDIAFVVGSFGASGERPLAPAARRLPGPAPYCISERQLGQDWTA